MNTNTPANGNITNNPLNIDWVSYHGLSSDDKLALFALHVQVMQELMAGLDLIALDLENDRPELLEILSNGKLESVLNRLAGGAE